MAVFEETPSREDYLDDTARLFCTITNSRIIDGHTEYILKVQRGYNKDNNWTIFKRYSEFVELHKNLKASYYDINLPPKKFFGNLDRQFIKERQQKLESYINKVVEHIVLASSVHLKQFLDPENYNPSIQDSGFENASMTLRESDFHSLKPLSYIGWRFNKQYGTVKRYNERKEYVLTWISEHSSRRFVTDKELQSAFKVLVDLSHPYIMPIVNGNTHWKGTLVIRSCCTKGSLREWIYERTAFDSFLDKCRYRNERIILPSVQVSTICIQVLNALSYLHKKNIPYGNLHTGNIFFEDNVAKISDIENGILGLPSFYKRFLVENRKIQTLEDVDVYCFGHVLYEMAFGERLMSCFHDSERSDCYDNLRPILRLLLSSSMDIKLPSVDQLLSSNAFSSNSTKIKFKTPSNCKFSSIAKEAMMKCKKNIEEGLLKEQNELRKHRKYVRLQEEVEAFERYDIQIKEKRKSRKKSSQLGNSMQSSDQFENMSNASTRTSFSTDSSSPNCGCDKSNENETNNAPKISPDSPSSSPSIPESNKSPSIPESNISPSIPESNNRSVFLQSIVNFNKGKLKKTNSNNIP